MNYGCVSLDSNQNGENVPLVLLDELETIVVVYLR